MDCSTTNGLPLERLQDLIRSPALKQVRWLVAGGAALLAVLLMARQLLRLLRRPERVSLVDPPAPRPKHHGVTIDGPSRIAYRRAARG